MIYKDKLFVIIMILYLFFIKDVNLRTILILSACFISLEYPLLYRKSYFWILIVLYVLFFCIGLSIGLLFLYTEKSLFEITNNYTMVILDIALVLALYYRDNEDFIFMKKTKRFKDSKQNTEKDIENL